MLQRHFNPAQRAHYLLNYNTNCMLSFDYFWTIIAFKQYDDSYNRLLGTHVGCLHQKIARKTLKNDENLMKKIARWTHVL